MKYNRVGIVAKPHEEVLFHLKKTLEILKMYGVTSMLEQTAAELLNDSRSGIPREKIAEGVDLLIVLGGDGTFLSIARQAVENRVPIAGFNLGTLGFLTEMKKESLETDLQEIFTGNAPVAERKLLEIQFQGNRFLALNDAVISKGAIARIISLCLCIDEIPITEVKGDGIIISTPTGSTAYSLAAGGPIVSPAVGGILLTPICPHALTFRPLVIPDASSISVSLQTQRVETFLTIDGQQLIPVAFNDTVTMRTAERKLKMILPKHSNFFHLLNEKLNWGVGQNGGSL